MSTAELNFSLAAPGLPGLDIERGLNIWRKADIYCKFLRKFAVDYAGSAKSMNRALAENERDTAAALAHKLKGVAANLGLPDVALQAGKIEQNLKEGKGAVEALVQLQQALDTSMESIACYAPEAVVTASATPTLDPTRLGRTRQLLLSLLEELNTDNPDRIEPLLDELANELPSEFLQLLHATVGDFDFRAAEAATRQLADSLNVSLKT